jgi:hypothetical protein
MLLKAGTVSALHRVARIVSRAVGSPGKAKIIFDVDPVDML